MEQNEWVFEYSPKQDGFHIRSINPPQPFNDWHVVFRGTEEEVWKFSDGVEKLLSLANSTIGMIKINGEVVVL